MSDGLCRVTRKGKAYALTLPQVILDRRELARNSFQLHFSILHIIANLKWVLHAYIVLYREKSCSPFYYTTIYFRLHAAAGGP